VSKKIPAQTFVFKALMRIQSQLYLASTSPHRRALLARLGSSFMTEHPGVVEDSRRGEAPAERAMRLAYSKAQAVAARHPADWVLGSDQVADCDGRILDKPGDADNCREQLMACSGRSVRFYTAAVLMRKAPASAHRHVDCTTVRFRRLEAGEIARYVDHDRPFDCAGGFRCEGLGIALFDAIDTSDPTALVGLPLIWLAGALREAGLDPLAAVQS
jgi:septum formation protein